MTAATTKVSRTCDQCNIPADRTNNGRLQVCGRCLAVSYCSKECQIEAYPSHKSFCKLTSQVVKIGKEQEALHPNAKPHIKNALKLAGLSSKFQENNTSLKADEFFQRASSALHKTAQVTTNPVQKKLYELSQLAFETKDPEKLVMAGLLWRRFNCDQLEEALGEFPPENVQPELLSIERIKGRLENFETLQEDLLELDRLGRRLLEITFKKQSASEEVR